MGNLQRDRKFSFTFTCRFTRPRRVGSGAEGGDELGATLGENFEAGAVDLVVHENQGGPVANAEGGGGGVELGFEEFEMVATGGVFSLESGFGIGAGAEHQRFHLVRLQFNERESESVGGR